MEGSRNGTGWLGDRRARRTEEVAEVFDQNYLAYQYCFVEFFINHVGDVSRSFRGDLQAMMVLALIGQQWLRFVRETVSEGSNAEAFPIARMSTSASRIADVTGIPRQTVRRKLAGLEKRGWIQKNEDGTYRMVSKEGETAARRDLSEVDRRAMRRVARLFADLEALVLELRPNAAVRDDEPGAGDGPDCGAQNEHLSPSWK